MSITVEFVEVIDRMSVDSRWNIMCKNVSNPLW